MVCISDTSNYENVTDFALTTLIPADELVPELDVLEVKKTLERVDDYKYRSQVPPSKYQNEVELAAVIYVNCDKVTFLMLTLEQVDKS